MSALSSVARSKFAIVCDSGCDLSLSSLERAKVSLVPLVVRMGGTRYRDCVELDPTDFFVRYSSTRGQVGVSAPSRGEFERCYHELVGQGVVDIVSLHTSSALSDAYDLALDAASSVEGAVIRVLDSRCYSGQLAIVLARMVADRDAGLSADAAVIRAQELASATRALFVPASESSPLPHGTTRQSGILGRADRLRTRALGLRRVFSVNQDGTPTELFSSNDLSRLAGNMARAMSAYARKVGPLTYVEVTAGVPRQLAAVEKPLVTNEFEATRSAILSTNPSTTARLGIGAVGLSYAPSSLIKPDEATSLMRPVD